MSQIVCCLQAKLRFDLLLNKIDDSICIYFLVYIFPHFLFKFNNLKN